MQGIEYLKALYKMEIISRLRIRALISALKQYGYNNYLNNLRNKEIQAVGVFFGSTGRFEATESSDYEFIFFRRDIDFTTKYLKREFNDKMIEISNIIVDELSELPEFVGSHPCGTIADYGVKRTWDFMYKNRRPMLVAYLFSYCFFSEPKWLHKEMKRSCLINFGINNIIKYRKTQMKVRKFKNIFKNPPNKEITISLYDLKDFGMDTIQSLSLLKLKEEAGHSLIDDVLKMRRKKYLNDQQTQDMILSILELYKARYLREDTKEISSTPMKLNGFKIAYEMLGN